MRRLFVVISLILGVALAACSFPGAPTPEPVKVVSATPELVRVYPAPQVDIQPVRPRVDTPNNLTVFNLAVENIAEYDIALWCTVTVDGDTVTAFSFSQESEPAEYWLYDVTQTTQVGFECTTGTSGVTVFASVIYDAPSEEP